MARQSPAAAGGCKHQFPVLLLSVFVFLPSLMECRQVPIFNLVPAAQNGLRINLVPADSLRSPNITSTERLKRAVQRSQGRLEKLQMISALNTAKLLGDDRMNDIVSRVSAGTGEFVMQTAIGTPALTFSAILDTGSDLVWAKCKPCTDCTNGSIYDPTRSSTYSKVPCHNSLCKPLPNFSCNRNGDCDYNYAYGDQSTTEGILSFETFNFSSQSIPNIAFGCGQDNQGIGFQEVGGLLGFGRGPLSLVSQLAPTVGNKFSYCLVSVTGSSSQTSPLFLGHTASLNTTTVRSTPIIQSRANPSFYYLSLQGISVGGQSLNIPAATFQLQADGSGGFIIDSGTTITYLPQSAYDAVKEALKSSIHLPQVDGSSFGLDLCFTKRGSSNSTVPAVTFHFQGADYDIPPENYLLPLSNNLLCFAMLPSASEGDISIFGNVQQQNFQIVYDNEKNVLSFAPTACDTL